MLADLTTDYVQVNSCHVIFGMAHSPTARLDKMF